MARHPYRKESYRWMATAYHEAGHAVAILLLGRTLLLVEVTGPTTGLAQVTSEREQLAQLIATADRQCRMPPELLRLWRDEFWMLDAGHIAEAEFNLAPDDALTSGALGDQLGKAALLEMMEEGSFAEKYFSRHLLTWSHHMTEDCRAFFRLPRIASLTRTLAEVLLRARHLEGWEVIDTLMANHAMLTGQIDLFWKPLGDVSFVRRRAILPKQLKLF